MNVLTTIYVPVADNDGHVFPDKLHQTLEALMVAKFGGYTYAGEVRGVWKNDGRIFADTNRVYEVASTLPDTGILLSFLRWVRKHYRQQSLAFKMNGVMEFLDEPWKMLTKEAA